MAEATENTLSEDAVEKALEQVVDPEIGMNVVDLGLIYDIEIQQDGVVTVNMTLTAPGCPAGDQILQGARTVIEELEDVETAEVNLVWEPMWSPDMMSERAKMLFGRM